MNKVSSTLLSFIFIISYSGPAFSNTGNIITESPEQPDLSLSEGIKDSKEVSPEEDAKLFKELSSPDANLFHTPSSLQANVGFWKRIYTEFTTNQVVIHDMDNLNIIYDIVDINDGGKMNNMKRGKVNEVRKKYKRILISIHNKMKRGELLNNEELEVYKKFDDINKSDRFRTAAENIRCQLGQKDRFLEGLKRSGRYIDKMKEILRYYSVPEELSVLPHVESSFNYNAYSSAGAAGIWQFTRNTGRLFMKIDYLIDERRDPIISTAAAAKLLRKNYETLGSWPLAIIAYNHGVNGMKRARETIGDEVTDIIYGYKSRIFGFASKNFYCEFLAALEIVKNYKRYFGDIDFEKPFDYDTFKVEKSLDIPSVSKHLGLSKDEIRDLNPALRQPVFTSMRYIPRGFELKMPKGRLSDMHNIYASIPKVVIKLNQNNLLWHQVEERETLGTIARMYKTTVAALMEINTIDDVNRIYKGQTLRLPENNISANMENGGVNALQNTIKVSVKPFNEEIKIKPAIVQNKESVRDPINASGHLNNESVRRGDTKTTSHEFQRAIYEVIIPYNNMPQCRDCTKKISYGFIHVEPDETIGHYADWSSVSVQKIREVNSLKIRSALRIGQRIKIPFIYTTKEGFEKNRTEYHLAIQEDFFSNYKIEGISTHTIKQGDTVWKLCDENEIPLWLLKRYNPDKDIRRLAMGEPLSLPIITKVN
jgi:membrane-bound lytic murein transglycosylase D